MARYARLTVGVSKTKMKRQKRFFTAVYAKTRRIPALALVALVVTGGVFGALVHADTLQQQIDSLSAQNAQNQGALNSLQVQAASYQDAINQLQVQISAIQAAIAASQAKQADLENQIQVAQAKLDFQKKALAQDLKAIYVGGQMSTVEMLASSKSLSDFIDAATYRNAIQNKIQSTLDQIAALQNQLREQKAQVEALLADQKTQESQLSSAQAQQQQLLAMNEGQQASYNQQIASNSAKIADLRRQQALLNSSYNIGNFHGDPSNGGYPSAWANAPQDSMIDDWGMYNRECVSYTAYRVHQDYLAGRDSRDMPWWGGVGNANQWDDNARAAGIPVDTNPTPGSIAISNAGYWGHAMYVEAVNGNEIYVQQYNQQLTGQYSEGWRYTTGLVFIHF